MKSGRTLRMLALALALLGSASFLQAQVGQAALVGVVLDSTRAVIPGAKVEVVNQRTGARREAQSNAQGYFSVPRLQPSVYNLLVTYPNFTDARVEDIALTVGQSRSVEVELKPQTVTASVEVHSDVEAPMQYTSASMGASVIQREVEDLPINGRQLSQLYLQAPGALNSGSGTFADIRFSGRATEQNAIRYDGIEGTAVIDAAPGNLNGEIPSPFRLQTSLENVQEFRVESNNYSAEYGTGSGGQISVVTKSGSNEFHGSVFEYLRNDRLDARNFFDRDTKTPLRMNQFGGSIGGPIKKNKVFFFGSYEGYQLRTGINFIEAVPSDVARARAVPEVLPLIDAFRAPEAVILPGASANPDFDIAQLNSSAKVDENAFGARFDFQLNDKNSLYFRFYRDQARSDQPEGVTGRRAVIRAVPQNGVLSFQSLLTPTVINEVKVGYNGALTRVNGVAPVVNGIDMSSIIVNITGSVANTGIAGQGSSTGVAIPGGLLRQNSATNGRGAPYTPYSLSFIDNISWAKGSHTVKAGGEVRLIRMLTDRQGGTTYTYSNLDAFLANTPQSIQYLGDVSAPSVFNDGATGWRRPEQEYYIGYVQDEWKVNPEVTFTYGARYEFYQPLREANNLNVQFDLINGTIFPPDRSFFQSSKDNILPRLGLAYAPRGQWGFLGGGKTVFRGGFGINVGPGQTEDQIQPIESDRVSSTLSGGAFPVDTQVLVENFVNNPDDRKYQPRAYHPDYLLPEKIYSYTFSIQQELPGRMILTAAYVGSQGRNLFLRNVTNRIIDVQTNPDPTQPAIVTREFDIVQPDGTILRPYAEIDYKTTGGHDSYDALQLSLVRRFSSGLTLNTQYAWGRSFGNTAGSNEAQTAANPFDYEYDVGYNRFDVRQTFNVSAVYSLPFGRGRAFGNNMGSAGQAILGNWEIGTIVNARTGLPVNMKVVRPDVVYVDGNGNVFSSPDVGRTAVINTLGGGASRNVRYPDLVPGVDPYLNNDRTLLNPAAFAIPAPGTFGNLMRGSIHGPNFRQFDLMLAKRFPFGEGRNVEFRADFFNITNTTNFANPGGTLPNALGTGTNQLQPGEPFTAAAAGTFGILRSTTERTVGLGTNRQIELGLRVNF